MGAKHAALFDQVFVVDDAQSLKPNRRGERVAAERRAMRTGCEDIHDVASRDESRDRQHAAAKRFAQDQAVWTNAFVFEGKPGPGAAEPRLDLVKNEQHTMRVADSANSCKPTGRRHNDASFALDRFDQHGRRLRRHRPFHGGEVAEGDRTKAWGERSEVASIIRFR